MGFEIVYRAKEYATAAHARVGQTRKYTSEPYIVHPRAVACILTNVRARPEVIAAGWLHDVVEDCGVSHAEIYSLFGADVSSLVEMVTDVSRESDGNRAVRKAIDRNHLERASDEGKTIKLADMIDNTSSICYHDTKFAHIYLGEKRELLPILHGGDPRLFQIAYDMMDVNMRLLTITRE